MPESDETTFEYEVPEGLVYVEIMPAAIHRRTAWENPADFQEFTPQIEVRSSRAPGRDPDVPGYVSIRTYKFRFRNGFKPWRTDVAYADARERLVNWEVLFDCHSDSIKNDFGKPLGTNTKAHDVIRAIQYEVLDRFAEEHPSWRRVSERLALEAKRDVHLSKAETHQLKAMEARAAADKLAERLVGYTAE